MSHIKFGRYGSSFHLFNLMILLPCFLFIPKPFNIVSVQILNLNYGASLIRPGSHGRYH